MRAIDTSAPVTTPAPVATSQPAIPPQGGQTLYLQVGAFSSHDNATRLQQEIQGQKLGTVRVVEAGSGTGTLYKVQVGPLSDAAEADKVVRALKPLGINESRSIVQ